MSINISVDKEYSNTYLSTLSMISITFLIVAMIFTYRIIEIGPFLTPGGVIPFSITYLIAGIITEVYGYDNAKKIIFGNFICIFIFNVSVDFLLKLPVSIQSNYQPYTLVFNHSLYIMLIYSLGFFLGDRINAYFMSKWYGVLKGNFFIIRLIGSSLIGQVSFSLIVIPSLYYNSLPPERLLQQFITTITAKLLVIALFSYACFLLSKIMKKIEKLNKKPRVSFNPF